MDAAAGFAARRCWCATRSGTCWMGRGASTCWQVRRGMGTGFVLDGLHLCLWVEMGVSLAGGGEFGLPPPSLEECERHEASRQEACCSRLLGIAVVAHGELGRIHSALGGDER